MRAIPARIVAIERGESRYFTGVPCKSGHVCERRVVGNSCVECQKAAHARMIERRGVEAHRESGRAAVARMRERMGEEAWLAQERARGLDYNRRNPEKRRASAKVIMARLYKEDPQRFIDRSRAFELQREIDNPEHAKLSRAARAAAYRIRQNAGISERGLTKVVRRVWDRCGGRCLCGSTENMELDHKRALANGGTNDERNLHFLCQTCNRSKGKRDFHEWLESRFMTPELKEAA